jgi:TfoX/Sxy family transcriptional regulator of competence genes
MASDQSFVDYVCDQADLAGRITTKRMFGEYAIYLDAKVVALICDNQVFVKPTEAGKLILGTTTEAPPYSGAKLHYQINEHLDDRAFVRRLLIETANVLPAPKPKPAKTPNINNKLAGTKPISKVVAKRSKKPDA